MNLELREQKLKEITQNQENIVKTGVELRYRGEFRKFNTYKIPLEYLVYNEYNGRIGSAVMSFEKQNHKLDVKDSDDIKIIEDFLWDSREDRNNETMFNLVKEHQREYGIVTPDGKIVDGNRRAMLLNRIYRNKEEWANKHHTDVSHCAYFEAIVLPDSVSKQEILELETRIQMGQEEKLDYNPIEKYLKCKQLKDNGFDVENIAEMMAEDKSEINKYLRILNLMEEYLRDMGYEGIYTRLEGREDHFITLTSFLERLRNNRATKVEWDYDEFDQIQLKSICFDYIRAGYEGKAFRKIFDEFFCLEDSWKAFVKMHKKTLDEAQEKHPEPSVQELREKNPDADLSKVLRARDNDWSTVVMSDFNHNFGQANSIVEATKAKNKPVELLQKSLNYLSKVNPSSIDGDCEEADEIFKLVREINKISFELKKIID